MNVSALAGRVTSCPVSLPSTPKPRLVSSAQMPLVLPLIAATTGVPTMTRPVRMTSAMSRRAYFSSHSTLSVTLPAFAAWSASVPCSSR
jgi:hypothetical protein